MAHRQPPGAVVTLLWIAGAFTALVGLIFAFFLLFAFAFAPRGTRVASSRTDSPSRPYVPVMMQDESSLSAAYASDASLNCGIRMPADFQKVIREIHPTGPSSISSGNADSGIMITRDQLINDQGRPESLDAHMQAYYAASDLHDAVIQNEGPTRLGQFPGYILTRSFTGKNGQPASSRELWLDSQDGCAYHLTAVCDAAAFPARVATFDSSFSTFLCGDAYRTWARTLPPTEPKYLTPAVPSGAPPPEFHLTFSDLDDALKYLPSATQAERRAAAAYLEHAPPTPADHDKVFAAARTLLNDPVYAATGIAIIKSWAIPADVPALREILLNMLQTGVANSGAGGAGHVQTMIELLSKFNDQGAAPAFAQCLQTPALRPSASKALLALGASAETAVQPATLSDDRATALEALKILSQIGTEKSTLTFYRAFYLKPPEISAAAQAALKDFAARLNLKPEQYMYIVYNHYALTPPQGFTADTTFTKPNARQWTHTAPNRAVKSIFTLSVKLVPPGYQLHAVPGTTTVVGTLTFQPVEASQADNLRQTVHYAAVDGEYLIDLVMTLDRTDIASAANLTSAVQTIHPQ